MKGEDARGEVGGARTVLIDLRRHDERSEFITRSIHHH